MADVVKHRPGIFKQSNKTHKTGRHRSKGLIHKDTKGRFVNSLSFNLIKCLFFYNKHDVPPHVVSSKLSCPSWAQTNPFL